MLFPIYILSILHLTYQSTPSFCVDFFYKNMNGITKLENDLNDYCKNFLLGKSLLEGQGCLTCKIRVINGLYDIPGDECISSICITPTTETCASDYADMATLTAEFVDTVNTKEKLLQAVNTEVELNTTITEEEKVISTSMIGYTRIKDTGTSLTYEIENKNNFPVKCYKYMSVSKRNAVKGDLSYVMKPKSKNVYTESYSYGDYDCKQYALMLTCYTVPYLEHDSYKMTYEITKYYNSPSEGSCEHATLGEIDKPDPQEKFDQYNQDEGEEGSSVGVIIAIVIVVLILGLLGYYFIVVRKVRVSDYVRIFNKH